MRKQRTHYYKTFKENAVKLSLERKNVTELAHELGIEPQLLYRWRKELQAKGPYFQKRSLIFRFIKDNKSGRWTIELMCRLLMGSFT